MMSNVLPPFFGSQCTTDGTNVLFTTDITDLELVGPLLCVGPWRQSYDPGGVDSWQPCPVGELGTVLDPERHVELSVAGDRLTGTVHGATARPAASAHLQQAQRLRLRARNLQDQKVTDLSTIVMFQIYLRNSS